MSLNWTRGMPVHPNARQTKVFYLSAGLCQLWAHLNVSIANCSTVPAQFQLSWVQLRAISPQAFSRHGN